MDCSQRYYAALWVPHFRLQAVLQTSSAKPPPTTDPIALIDGDSHRGQLLEVNACAQSLLVRPGMPASQALARAPTLHLVAASASAEASLHTRLFRFVESLCPRVEQRAPDQWLLDLRGLGAVCWNTWGQTALKRLRAHEGIEATLGIAPKPDLAAYAARRAQPVRVIEAPQSFFEELRFDELGASPALCQQLHDWGLSTLGDLLRLPRQQTLERLGPEAAALWETARDSRESVLRLETFPEPFELGTDFEHPVETVDPLRFSIHRIIEQLCSRLRLLHRVASEIYLQLALEEGPPYHRSLSIPAPSRDEPVLLRILETHLETLHFDSPIVALHLRLGVVLPDSRQLALFENPLRDPNRFGETLARLRALVGEPCVGVPLPLNSHRPDTFAMSDPLNAFTQRPTSPPPLPQALQVHGTLLGLPLRRFRPPLKVDVQLHAHRPKRLKGHLLQGPVEDCRGPFRLTGHWWDANAWAYEQWDIQLGGTSPGLYRISRSSPPLQREGPWQVDGFYEVIPLQPSRRSSTAEAF